MSDSEAIRALESLIKLSGALRVITNEHTCQPKIAPCHPSTPGFDPNECERFAREELRSHERFGNMLADPRHFVIHDAVRLLGPDARGRYTAETAEGDFCYGPPDALLARLQEAK